MICVLFFYSLFRFFEIIFNIIYFVPTFVSSKSSQILPMQLCVLFLSKKNQSRQIDLKNKINKTKKDQNKKCTKKNHGAHFLLAKYSWAWKLPWNVVYIPSNTPLKKTDFPFPRMQIVSWLRVRFCVHIPF